MQTLTLEGVKAAARAAHSAGTLTAQAPDLEDRKCWYRRGDRCCAIGAGFTPKTLAAVAERCNVGVGIGSTVMQQYVTIDEDEREEISKIQTQHDKWCRAIPSERDSAERAFLAAIA